MPGLILDKGIPPQRVPGDNPLLRFPGEADPNEADGQLQRHVKFEFNGTDISPNDGEEEEGEEEDDINQDGRHDAQDFLLNNSSDSPKPYLAFEKPLRKGKWTVTNHSLNLFLPNLKLTLNFKL